MRKNIVSRLIAISFGLIAALAAPGQSFAHGEAHHEAHERVAHQAGESHGLVSAVSSPDEDEDHQHARVDSTTRVRADELNVAPALPVRATELLLVARSVVAPGQRQALTPGDQPTGPPPRLRAPPAR